MNKNQKTTKRKVKSEKNLPANPWLEAEAKFKAILADPNLREDSESAHHVADAALLTFLEQTHNKDIADMWREVRDKVGFWYA